MTFPVVTTLLLSVVVCVLMADSIRRRTRPRPEADTQPRPEARPEQWHAVVRTAQMYMADSFSYHRIVEDVRGEVAVRIVRGDDFLTIGTIGVGADDFDELLHAVVAQAEDRAAALNAVLEMVAA